MWCYRKARPTAVHWKSWPSCRLPSWRWRKKSTSALDGEGALIENWYTRSRRDSVLAIVKLAPPEVRDMTAKEASVRLRELMGDVPDAREVSVRYTDNDNGPGFELSIRHPDLDVLRAATCNG